MMPIGDDGTIGITDPGYTPPPPGSKSNDVPQWRRPSGAPMDEGFYVWLSHHGVTPGDSSKLDRMQEFKENYLSLPQADHDAYISYGRSFP